MSIIMQIQDKMLEVYTLMKENKMYGLHHTISFETQEEMIFNIKIKQPKKKQGVKA